MAHFSYVIKQKVREKLFIPKIGIKEICIVQAGLIQFSASKREQPLSRNKDVHIFRWTFICLVFDNGYW